MNKITLTSDYFGVIAEQLTRLGHDGEAWLATAGLSKDDLSESRVELSNTVFCELINDALQRSQTPELGLIVGEQLLINSHGMLSFAAISVNNLRQLLGLVERFIGLRVSFITVKQHQEKNALHVIFESTIELHLIERTVMEVILLAIKNALDFITANDKYVNTVLFSSSGYDDIAVAESYFDCEVKYNQPWSAIVLTDCDLDAPLKMANPASFEAAETLCKRELQKLSNEASYTEKLTHVLLNSNHQFFDLDAAATLWNMTPRTLHRRLKEEGSSYKNIMASVKQKIAQQYLQQQTYTIQQIAYLLGYSDVSNFRRAFKQWAGLSPAQYRKQQYDAEN